MCDCNKNISQCECPQNCPYRNFDKKCPYKLGEMCIGCINYSTNHECGCGSCEPKCSFDYNGIWVSKDCSITHVEILKVKNVIVLKR
ncbi:hypothetical protein U3516DRAFT_760300 [Neocallimastix sp. 'constans']